jgi:hypothetical protein
MKILVDNSVRHHAIEHKGKWESMGAAMWGGKNGIPVETGGIISTEHPINIKGTKGGPQGGYIASLALAYRHDKWEAHTSDVIQFEQLNQPGNKFSSGNIGDFSWLREVKYKHNKTLDSFTFAIPVDCPNDALRKFLASSNNQDYEHIRTALEQCGAKKSSQDAWHLHCVSLLTLDKFLTCDHALIGQIRSIADRALRQKLLGKVTLPMHLCKTLGLDEATAEEREQLRREFSFFH